MAITTAIKEMLARFSSGNPIQKKTIPLIANNSINVGFSINANQLK